MLTHGNSREVAYKFHADCQDASSKGFNVSWPPSRRTSPRSMPAHPHRCSHRQLPSWPSPCRPSRRTTHPKRVRRSPNPIFRQRPLPVQRHAARTATAQPPTRPGRGCDAGHRTPSEPSQRRFQPRLRRAPVPQPQHGLGTHLLYVLVALCSGCSSSSPASSCCTPNARSASRSPIAWASFLSRSSAATSANGRYGPPAAGRNGHPRRSSPSPGSRTSPARSGTPCCGACSFATVVTIPLGIVAHRAIKSFGRRMLTGKYLRGAVKVSDEELAPAGAQEAPGDPDAASARSRCRPAASASIWPSSAAPAPARPRRSWACWTPSARAATRP